MLGPLVGEVGVLVGDTVGDPSEHR
jgi:hypothetical protein